MAEQLELFESLTRERTPLEEATYVWFNLPPLFESLITPERKFDGGKQIREVLHYGPSR